MNLFAKVAMVLSFAYYFALFAFIWIGQILGVHNEVWELYDFPTQPSSPPLWTLLVGLMVTLGALACLASAYRSAWLILNGGPNQDFRRLGKDMRLMAWGLIGFWLGYNLLAGAVQHLIVIDLQSTDGFEFEWDPLDLDIVFAIVGIVLLAISRTLDRAWLAEEETKHFL